MFSYLFFAATPLDMEETRPIMEIGIWIMGAVLVVGVLYLAITFFIIPIIKFFWRERHEKAEASRTIQFDLKESMLYRGYRSLKVPENSLEYFVCKLVFEELDKPQLDLNVLEAAGKDPLDQRAVYQAVRRLNDKAKKALELKDDLLTRGREKTSLNDIERLI